MPIVDLSLNIDNEFLIHMASHSHHRKHKHAALVFSDGQLVAFANNTDNHHAEFRALQVAWTR